MPRRIKSEELKKREVLFESKLLLKKARMPARTPHIIYYCIADKRQRGSVQNMQRSRVALAYGGESSYVTVLNRGVWRRGIIAVRL